MKLDHIELSRLSISPLNMRAKRPPDIANILPSVRARGVIVPLLVRPANDSGDAYEIVAGKRRYLAASAVAEETGESPALPCAIMEAGDDAAALEASLIENFARLAPDEVTQWETFTRLVKEGQAAEDIAATFGITERLVRRILALGNLLPRIRGLYRQEKLDASTVRHLTMATRAQQKDWLALYDSEDGHAPSGQRLKEWLCGGQLIATKTALFDLALYTGPIVSDLFGEDSYFAEPDLFWMLQREAIEARRQAYLEQGWAAAELIEPAYHFHHWEYEKRPKKQGGRVYLTLSTNGEVEVHEGLLPRREAARQDREERSDSTAKADRPELTAALRNYLDLHRHAAVRARLLNHPGLALRLLIAHAITNAGYWTVGVENQASDRSAIAESVETSRAEASFDEKRRAAIAVMDFDPECVSLIGGGRRAGAMTLLDRLSALGDEEVLAVAAIVMGETLEAGSGVADALGTLLEVDMADLWEADEPFFELIRDKKVLTAMVAELAGQDAAAANAGQTGKVLKGIIRDCLAGENGRARVDNWVPKWLLFPTGSYRLPAELPNENDPPEGEQPEEETPQEESDADPMCEAAE